MSDDDEIIRRLTVMMADASRQAAEEARRVRRPAKFDSEQVEQAILRLNRIYAVLAEGGQVRVIRERKDEAGRVVQVESFTTDAFKQLEATETYWYGGARPEGIGAIWLRHRGRREYRFGMALMPEGAPDGVYNSFGGWAVQASEAPLEEACPTFLDHVRTNVAGGNESHFNYIMAWCAHMFQKPAERLGVALVLRGLEGSGKTKFGEIIGRLLGRHYLLVDDPRYLVGNFNSHMEGCLCLQCDEALWAGDKSAEGRLKGLITSAVHMVERKNVDPVSARNLVRLIMTSNEGWVIPAGPDARRYAVFDVASWALGNSEYFSQIDSEMADGGLEALLGYFLRFDLAAVNLRSVPKTAALSDQKAATMPVEVKWYMSALLRGSPTRSLDHWPGMVRCDQLYADMIRFAEDIGVRHRLDDSRFGKELRKLMPPVEINKATFERSQQRVSEEHMKPDGSTERRSVVKWFYTLPGLNRCRRVFAARWGLDCSEWAGGLEEESDTDTG
jgi:hypothetical protein